ncbi:MAG: ROK family protein [Candidatus Cloacimonetes bacterium]|nr:ROK family protein [Candidatus Cloacimonadota bacterium]
MASLGIDLGGTKTAFGIVDKSGKVTHRHEFPSASTGYNDYIKQLIHEIQTFFDSNNLQISDLKNIGIGCAGQIELNTGKIFHAPNLGWRNVEIGRDLKEAFQNIVVTVDNDVRAATVGEYLFGLKSRPSSYINVFLGTGIGSGLILQNKIIRGASNSAGEIGHISIQHDGPLASSRNRGIYEYFASGTALGRYGQELADVQSQFKANTSEERFYEALNGANSVDGKLVGELALSGNKDAIALVEKTAYFIGVGITNIINLLNPEVISYGGGLANLGDILIQPMIKTIQERSIPSALEKLTIVPTNLGNDGGIIGASHLHLIQDDGSILAL